MSCSQPHPYSVSFFYFNDAASTEIYTLSLHDALPILIVALEPHDLAVAFEREHVRGDSIEEPAVVADDDGTRSEEHTSELQSHVNLVCRLLLEKKNTVPHLCVLGSA